MPLAPTNFPLTTRRLAEVYRELDEVAVAVSIVGTTKVKLNELAGYVELIADALVGIRSEVNRVRTDLRQAAHNIRRARGDARKSSDAIWKGAEAVDDAKILVKRRRLGDVPLLFDAGPFTLFNVWGYSETEVRAFMSGMRDVSSNLRNLGLEFEAPVVLDPKRVRFTLLAYDEDGGFVSDPTRSVKHKELYEAIARRVWVEDLERSHRETWKKYKPFQDAFVKWVQGRVVIPDAQARLRATLGRIATKRWAA